MFMQIDTKKELLYMNVEYIHPTKAPHASKYAKINEALL